ncbi:MAG: hypothetical protein HC781_17910 [Leptolyngbyaceae cyanobacterium CSU_1_4]|nr:hypothetical protein [Leptolyngbyaceae cyanobacterium CSU_1_4]
MKVLSVEVDELASRQTNQDEPPALAKKCNIKELNSQHLVTFSGHHDLFLAIAPWYSSGAAVHSALPLL